MVSGLSCCAYVVILLFHRLMKLLEEIMQEKENKTLMFVETKRKADELQRRMKRDGYVITPIYRL